MAKSNAKTAEPEVTDLSDGEFELMFGKTADEVPPVEPAAAKDPEPEPDPVVDKLTDEEKAAKEKEEAEAAAKAKADEEAEAAKAAEKAEADAKAKADREAKQKQEQEEAEAAAKKAAEEREARMQMSDDEKALAAEMAKDFPDVQKTIEIKERIMEAKYEARLAEMEERLLKRMAPMAQTVSVVAGDAFDRAIKSEHPDAYDILPEVEAWVEKQPSFLRDAYNRVLDSGTAAETVELFTTYKQTTGKVKSPDELAAEQAAKEAAEKEQREKEEKLASMEGVRSRQTAKPETEPSTFEDGFERAGKVV